MLTVTIYSFQSIECVAFICLFGRLLLFAYLLLFIETFAVLIIITDQEKKDNDAVCAVVYNNVV